MPHTPAKLVAARAALEYLEQTLGDNDWRLGIGTGSTVNAFIDLLARSDACQQGRIDTLVSSSKASAGLLVEHGMRVTDANQVIELDAYVDGADRLTKNGCMIKGGGGAMFGEKLVAHLAREFVCIAEPSKLVGVLGDFPVAVEVAPSARSYVARKLVALGGQPELREGFVTDQGNLVLDTHNLDLSDPQKMEDAINAITGVLDNGVFAHKRARVMLLGENDSARRIDA